MTCSLCNRLNVRQNMNHFDFASHNALIVTRTFSLKEVHTRAHRKYPRIILCDMPPIAYVPHSGLFNIAGPHPTTHLLPAYVMTLSWELARGESIIHQGNYYSAGKNKNNI